MDFEKLRQKLIRVARIHPPSEAVPYAFVQRIMARLEVTPSNDSWTIWGQVLWRATAPCLAIMCATTLWAAVSGDLLGTTGTLAAELDDTVLAPLTHLTESW